MLKSKKHVFWEALLITIVVFFGGVLLGVGFENQRTDKIEQYYAISEVSLIDVIVLQELGDLSDADCSALINANIDFANKIYEEALILQNYEDANKLTDDLKITHKKYDLLRTFVWINSLEIFERCSEEEFTPVVYLYEYETEDLDKRAVQNVWSRILEDLKAKRGDEVILLPIAGNNDLSSVDAMIEQFDIERLPVIIIGNKEKLYELSSVSEIEKILEESDSMIKLN
jgi:hypothetical protein